MLYVTGKKCEEIIKKLISDLKQISNWLVKNNLVVNIKNYKIECVLYGTHQKTSESELMEIIMNQTKITVSYVYEYLGAKMDRILTFSDRLEGTIKGQ